MFYDVFQGSCSSILVISYESAIFCIMVRRILPASCCEQYSHCITFIFIVFYKVFSIFLQFFLTVPVGASTSLKSEV